MASSRTLHENNPLPTIGVYREILRDYRAYEGEWGNTTEEEKKAMTPHILPLVAWYGHFYAGRHETEEYKPFIEFVDHLNQVNPEYVQKLIDALNNPENIQIAKTRWEKLIADGAWSSENGNRFPLLKDADDDDNEDGFLVNPSALNDLTRIAIKNVLAAISNEEKKSAYGIAAHYAAQLDQGYSINTFEFISADEIQYLTEQKISYKKLLKKLPKENEENKENEDKSLSPQEVMAFALLADTDNLIKAIKNAGDTKISSRADPEQGKKLLKLAFDLDVLRTTKIQKRKTLFNEDYAKLTQQGNVVTHPELSEAERAALAGNTAFTVAAGEAGVGAVGMMGLLFGIWRTVVAPFALLSGFLSNFFLMLNPTFGVLGQLESTTDLTDKLSKNNPVLRLFQKTGYWLYDCFIGFNLKLYMDEKGKNTLPWYKKGLSLFAILMCSAVGGLFGYLAMGSVLSLLTAGLAVAAIPLTAPVIGLTAATVLLIAASFSSASEGLARSILKWSARALLLGLGVTLGVFAPYLWVGMAVGIAITLAVCETIALTSLFSSEMIGLIKRNDTCSRVKGYFKEALGHPAWRALSRMQKVGHVLGHCVPRLLGIGLTLCINALSLIGQFTLFSATMLGVFGRTAAGTIAAYSSVGLNAAAHLLFGWLNVDKPLIALFKGVKHLFVRDTFAEINDPKQEDKPSRLQSKSGWITFLTKCVGIPSTIINGIGQGGLYGMGFMATAASVPLALGLVAVFHVPLAIAAVVVGIGCAGFSILPNIRAMNDTLDKNQAVHVSMTTACVNQQLSSPAPGLQPLKTPPSPVNNTSGTPPEPAPALPLEKNNQKQQRGMFTPGIPAGIVPALSPATNNQTGSNNPSFEF